jgi:hypothetical protein
MRFTHRGETLGINLRLAISQSITFEELCQIVERHKIREDLLTLMEATQDKNLIQIIFNQLTVNEFELQMLWGFQCDARYHKSWWWPHCICPKMDNEDSFPYQTYVTKGCPLHDIL